MSSWLFARKFLIEAVYSALFVGAFHWTAATPFQMFIVFATFTIFLNVRTGSDFAEIRAQNYLLLRYVRKQDDPELSTIATNMETVFDGEDLLGHFTDERKHLVSAQYSGQIFSRIVSAAAQMWMLGFILWSLNLTS
ncbi:MAG: hypothetical protein EOR43_32260 [Mesorhizobium sp.]|uniref:hypothetical protein n=1 Tax=Mesorhizobium sp. TaxID=1871066 RepID=UPI000FE3CEAC|nr:hypothetical protein [Mesorhizobium sp.]RWK14791.1 MAG: hypothetical protein EOR43_32260 [Mesorhizobium sp.]RWK32614.1 MAG: hypothetical protein EOR44_10395 [Mesorhizobium sp.]